MLPFVLRDGREVIVVMHHDLPDVLKRLFAAGGRPPVGVVEKLLKEYIDKHIGPVDPFADDDDDDDDDDDWPQRRPVVFDLVQRILDDQKQRKQQLEGARRVRQKKYPRHPRCPRCQACPCARGVPHDMVPVHLASRGECPTCGAKRPARGEGERSIFRNADQPRVESVPAENGPVPVPLAASGSLDASDAAATTGRTASPSAGKSKSRVVHQSRTEGNAREQAVPTGEGDGAIFRNADRAPVEGYPGENGPVPVSPAGRDSIHELGRPSPRGDP